MDRSSFVASNETLFSRRRERGKYRSIVNDIKMRKNAFL